MARQRAGVQLDYSVHSFPDLSRFLVSHSGRDDDETTKGEVVRAFAADAGETTCERLATWGCRDPALRKWPVVRVTSSSRTWADPFGAVRACIELRDADHSRLADWYRDIYP